MRFSIGSHKARHFGTIFATLAFSGLTFGCRNQESSSNLAQASPAPPSIPAPTFKAPVVVKNGKEPPTDISDYISKVGVETRSATIDCTGMALCLDDLAKNPSLSSVKEWTNNSLIAYGDLIKLGSEMSDNAPAPAECEELQRNVVALGKIAISFGQQFKDAIDHPDATAAHRIESSIHTYNVQYALVTKGLDALKRKYHIR